MATTPTAGSGGTFAVRPTINIFAEPRPRQDPASTAAREHSGIFDDAAACPSRDARTYRVGAGRMPGAVWACGAGLVRRSACLVAVAAAVGLCISIVDSTRDGHARPAPPTPALARPRFQQAVRAAKRSPSPRIGMKQRRPRKRHKSDRTTRRRQTTDRGPRAPQPAAPQAAPRAAPTRAVPPAAPPTRSRPRPVAADGPPEFM
jgi:hypothetical protein